MAYEELFQNRNYFSLLQPVIGLCPSTLCKGKFI